MENIGGQCFDCPIKTVRDSFFISTYEFVGSYAACLIIKQS